MNESVRNSTTSQRQTGTHAAAEHGAELRVRSSAAGWIGRALRAPLLIKLMGANALIVLAAAVGGFLVHERGGADVQLGLVLVAALGVTLLVNAALVLLALRPLRELEEVATRVWRGDLRARVTPSPLADRDIARVGRTLNGLLDDLMADRDRTRRLASEIIRAADVEREYIAHSLHDSTAQSLAALTYQLTATSAEVTDASARQRLEEIRRDLGGLLEDVRLLAQSVHPRVLHDLGLPAALRQLARQAGDTGGPDVELELNDGERIPAAPAAVLYRVAHEAVNNSLRHADAHAVRIRLDSDDMVARLEVADDGAGFDPADVEKSDGGPGKGLFTMRERIELIDGQLDIVSRPGKGTRILATVPLSMETGNARR